MDPDIDVDIEAARALHAGGAPWIDVREPDEWEQARIAGTHLRPLSTVLDAVQREFPDRSTPLLLSCAVGGRSRRAALALRHAGYTGARNVDGGIRAWIESGLPVESGPEATSAG